MNEKPIIMFFVSTFTFKRNETSASTISFSRFHFQLIPLKVFLKQNLIMKLKNHSFRIRLCRNKTKQTLYPRLKSFFIPQRKKCVSSSLHF